MGGDDTLITMELINAPKNLNYTTLQDPAEVRKKKMAQRKEEEKAAM